MMFTEPLEFEADFAASAGSGESNVFLQFDPSHASLMDLNSSAFMFKPSSTVNIGKYTNPHKNPKQVQKLNDMLKYSVALPSGYRSHKRPVESLSSYSSVAKSTSPAAPKTNSSLIGSTVDIDASSLVSSSDIYLDQSSLYGFGQLQGVKGLGFGEGKYPLPDPHFATSSSQPAEASSKTSLPSTSSSTSDVLAPSRSGAIPGYPDQNVSFLAGNTDTKAAAERPALTTLLPRAIDPFTLSKQRLKVPGSLSASALELMKRYRKDPPMSDESPDPPLFGYADTEHKKRKVRSNPREWKVVQEELSKDECLHVLKYHRWKEPVTNAPKGTGCRVSQCAVHQNCSHLLKMRLTHPSDLHRYTIESCGEHSGELSAHAKASNVGGNDSMLLDMHRSYEQGQMLQPRDPARVHKKSSDNAVFRVLSDGSVVDGRYRVHIAGGLAAGLGLGLGLGVGEGAVAREVLKHIESTEFALQLDDDDDDDPTEELDPPRGRASAHLATKYYEGVGLGARDDDWQPSESGGSEAAFLRQGHSEGERASAFN